MIDKTQYEIFKKAEYIPYNNNGKNFLLNKNLYLDIVFNDTCNSRCRFCVADLQHDKIKHADIDSFKPKIKYAIEVMGVKEVLLLGGEPTINDDIFLILDYLKQFNLNKICITTNGFRITSDFDYCKKLLSSGITHVNISIMNTDENRQKYISQTNKSISISQLEKVKSVAEENGVMVRINTNIFNGNLDSVDEMVNHYFELCHCCDSLKFSPLLVTDNFSTVNEVTEFNRAHILSPEDYEKLFKEFEDLFKFEIFRNKECFGFVEYSLISRPQCPIIMNYNHRGQMMNKVVNENKINNLKLLPTGDLSLSWNRELKDYFIKID